MSYRTLATPVGTLSLVSDSLGLLAIGWPGQTLPSLPDTVASTASEQHSDLAVEQLERYFAGELREFTVPLNGKGTAFQQQVWNALVSIPFGETTSYGSIARALDNPNGSRAVGAAVGKNPLPIVVPCHRVVGSDGSLTGFAGGLDCKHQLLALEQHYLL